MKAFIVNCICTGKDHDKGNKKCDIELFMNMIMMHNFSGKVVDILHCESMDAPIVEAGE